MIYIGITAGIFLLELLLKNYIETHKDAHSEEMMCKNMLIIRKYHNKGAFLDMGECVRPLVAMVSLLLTAAVTVVFVLTLGQRGRGVLKAGLALKDVYGDIFPQGRLGQFNVPTFWATLSIKE